MFEYIIWGILAILFVLVPVAWVMHLFTACFKTDAYHAKMRAYWWAQEVPTVYTTYFTVGQMLISLFFFVSVTAALFGSAWLAICWGDPGVRGVIWVGFAVGGYMTLVTFYWLWKVGANSCPHCWLPFAVPRQVLRSSNMPHCTCRWCGREWKYYWENKPFERPKYVAPGKSFEQILREWNENMRGR